MFEFEEILKWLGSIWWFIVFWTSFVAALALLSHRVRVHDKAMFTDDGKLKFVTKEENYVHLSDQLVKDKNVAEKIQSMKHEECPLHAALEQSQLKLERQQGINMIKLNGLGEAMVESKKLREDMNNKLSTICINVNTLLVNQAHMTEDIREIKKKL